MGLAANIGKWAKDTEKELDKRNKAIIFELFSSVVTDTPVLTGRLRANWVLSLNEPSSDIVNKTDKNEVTINQIKKRVQELKPGENFSVFLSNNLPYAYRIEFEGYSRQKAPQGMVRKNFIRVVENLKR